MYCFDCGAILTDDEIASETDICTTCNTYDFVTIGIPRELPFLVQLQVRTDLHRVVADAVERHVAFTTAKGV